MEVRRAAHHAAAARLAALPLLVRAGAAPRAAADIAVRLPARPDQHADPVGLAPPGAPGPLQEETESAGDSPSGATPAAVLLPDPSELPIVNMDYALSARLPREEWAGAIAFFSRQPASPSSTASSPPPARSVDGEDCPSALCLAQQAA